MEKEKKKYLKPEVNYEFCKERHKVRCLMKNCNYEYDSNMLMTNVSKMADHMKYHADLKKQGSLYFDGTTLSFPCTVRV